MISIKKIVLVAAMLAMAGCASKPQKPDTADATANSVKITNMAKNHGGTGIILRSSDTASLVLTNSHVCGVVEDGGLVTGQAGSFMVTEYKRSEQHDLCLIRVAGNLHGRVKLASRPPDTYHERALISGHPALYPNVKTVGHFSGREPIAILVGFKPCTDEEKNDPDKGMMCMIVGGMPIVKEFDSVLVTATIMPGSSGSGVYNSNMELSGVVFAGQGGLGYAWTVPYEYLRSFLTEEAGNLEYSRPTNMVALFSGKGSQQLEFMKKAEAACDSSDKTKIQNLCDLMQNTLMK